MESNYIFSKQRERLYCMSRTWPGEVVGITEFCTNRKSCIYQESYCIVGCDAA